MSDDLLRRVADELDIRNTLARIAHLSDYGSLEDYVSLFTEDAHWEMLQAPGAPAVGPAKRGRADIMAGATQRRATGGQGPGSNTRHVLTNTVVTLDGDKARAHSYLVFYKNTNTKPEIAIL